MKLAKTRIKIFQKMIFDWWKVNRRDLPWRRTHNPYKILVSEVMLQQTQVLRVISKYDEFIRRFPTIKALSKATTADVLRIWKGLGYNRRALYLKKIAEAGIIPKSEKELIKLPGVGIYTARALLVFAFGQSVHLVDTNIRKIITHFFFSDKQQKEMDIEDVARQLIPPGKSWEWHQALMDYGALALPNEKWQIAKKKQKPFKNSNRFYRGRIVDKLREGNISGKKLLHEFTEKYNISKEFIKTILDGLIRDGLVVEKKNSIFSLPDS